LDNRPLKSPKEINRNLSEHINTAITLGMALEKGDRPQSMSDWLQQLELPPQTVNQEQIDTEKDEKSLTYIGSSFEEFLQTLEEGETPSSDEEFLQMLKEDISESPPAVESQYRQETVNPPRLVTPSKELEAVQQKPTVNPNSSQNSIQEKLKDVPWGSLIVVFLVYGLSGYILGINSAPWQFVALASVWVGALR
jgi:serine/threonine-protein kinase